MKYATNQISLFDVRRREYGVSYAAKTTSHHAALTVKAGTLKAAILKELALHPRTPDECAYILGKSVLSIRPRFTELEAEGWIVTTGNTRQNESGKMANEYRLTTAQERKAA